MVARTDCGAGQFGGQRGQIARNRAAQDQAGASTGGCPEWLVLLVLDTVPARGGTFCKADWAPRARNPIFVCHTSATECKQKWTPRKVNSGLPAGWLPDLFTSSPAVSYVLRLGCRKTLENLWFSYVSKENIDKT